MAVMVVIALLLLLSGADQVRSSASDHRYKEGEVVPLYANKVGPFHNPRYIYKIVSVSIRVKIIKNNGKGPQTRNQELRSSFINER